MAANLRGIRPKDSVEPTAAEARMDPSLMVIVPHHLPARAATLSEALAGTTIRVQIDRRRGERRRAQLPATVQRRQSDRRSDMQRVVAYVYACPVIAVGTPSTSGTLSNLRASSFSAGSSLASAGVRLN
jgi:hypothetical protein